MKKKTNKKQFIKIFYVFIQEKPQSCKILYPIVEIKTEKNDNQQTNDINIFQVRLL